MTGTLRQKPEGCSTTGDGCGEGVGDGEGKGVGEGEEEDGGTGASTD